MNILGRRIKTLREEKRLNQVELSKMLNISNTTLSQYETGQRVPSDEIKIKIAKTFEVSLDYLLGVSNTRNIETIAAHKEGEEYTEDELKDIEDFKKFVRSRRKE